MTSNAPAAGTVFAIGGALKPDSDAVWQRLVDEAGGAGAPIAVFPTAAYEPERIAAQIVAALGRCGACAEVVPVAPHLQGVDLQAQLHDPALIARVAASRAVFFSGGAQEYIVDTLMPGGRATAMLDAIRAVFAAGGVIAGTSAGAAAMSRMMFRDAMDNLLVLKGQWRAGQEYDRGLDFLGPDLLIDQHFIQRGRIGRMLPAMRALGYRIGLGVDENAAVIIKGGRLEIVGGSGAVLVDLGEASSDAALPAFNLRGARLSYLAAGDCHDLASGVTTPARHKLGGPCIAPTAAGFTPGLKSDRYFLDILGNGCLLDALAQLLDGPAPEVRGLAYRANPRPGDPAPGLGFEFRLHRDAGLRGWRGAAPGGEDWTVLGARLDVIPVQLASPLFTPLAALPRGVVESVQAGRGGPGSTAMATVSGEFSVGMAAQAAEDGSAGIGRMVLDKRYHGALEARGAGQMLATHGSVAGSAAYVALESVTGTLQGREGSFALVHHGLMERGQPSLDIAVVPDSGSGALAGLAGRMRIRVEGHQHFYDFDFSLPEA